MSDDQLERDRAVVEQAVGSTAGHQLKGAMLVGWVVVAEWMTPDGERWLTKFNARDTTRWQVQGYMHNTLYEPWDPDG